jgi:hypothetical protein
MAAEHAAYLITQMKARKIVMTGKTDSKPSAASIALNGAAAIFTGMDWREVEEIMKQDPYYRAGIATVAGHTVWNACEPEKSYLPRQFESRPSSDPSLATVNGKRRCRPYQPFMLVG